MGGLALVLVGLVTAAATATLSVRLARKAVRSLGLHRRGVRTTGRVDSIRHLEDSEGNPYARALVAFELPDQRTGWTDAPWCRPDGTAYAPGDRVPVLYDPQHPTRAHTLPPGRRPQLRVRAGVLALLAAVAAAGAATAAWLALALRG
ncbi:DUF3592 domain-containing protein [Kitasatospora sp. HPMI-4]|uniref:DUF3592 domain-containing protein n=1 Tax=Kitasatospora sp. HPMI-4 TaxID=3448443 RepID=UPI003F1AFECB